MGEDEAPAGGAESSGEAGRTRRASLRPRHCWEIARQIPGAASHCEECYAYFVQQDCWTLWALRRPGFKPCCQKEADCATCAILVENMRPEPHERLRIAPKAPGRPEPATTKQICAYLQLFEGGAEVAGEDRPVRIGRALRVRNADFRCRLRGVHLDAGYVDDICVSRRVRDCAFLDDVRPEVQVRPVPPAQGRPVAPAIETHRAERPDREPARGIAAKHTPETPPAREEAISRT